MKKDDMRRACKHKREITNTNKNFRGKPKGMYFGDLDVNERRMET
jgi:hypothetical protein